MTATVADFAPARWSYGRAVIAMILASVVVRLVCAAWIPLAGDELLYLRYSQHLAPGYIDHPGVNATLIRLGTTVFSATPFGVRVLAVLLGLPASWAVWRAATLLFQNERAGATAALFFNLTVTMTMGSLLATSDSSVVVTSAFLLFFLAKLDQTERGAWWLAIGAAFGLGMFSKYTTLFFAASMLIWLIAVPAQRRWFLNPWPYLGGLLALAVFEPVLWWNAEHHWASVAYQASRGAGRALSLRYVFELIGAQLGLATPPIFFLACVGLGYGLRTHRSSAVVLLAALILTPLGYFCWHALRERVQGNWPECVYPALACVAAYAVHSFETRDGVLARSVRVARLSAAPFGIALALLIYTQAIFGWVPIGRHDPTSRVLGWGWPEMAVAMDEARAQSGARVFLTTDYSVASALAHYLPSHTPVEQVNDRIRWVAEPAPQADLFRGAMIYACKQPCAYAPQLSHRFGSVAFLGAYPRVRNGAVVERYELWRVAAPKRSVLDPLYPIRTKASDAYTL